MPGEGDATARELEEEQPTQARSATGSERRRNKSSSPRRGEEDRNTLMRGVRSGQVFTTRQSWEERKLSRKGTGGDGPRSSGQLPEEEGKRMGRRTEGRLPSPKVERVNQERREEHALQRALEQEMVFGLHEENMELKNQIWELQHKWKPETRSSTGWSEVTSGSGDQRMIPPPPDPPGQREWQRFTPNGTKVTEHTPPLSPQEAPHGKEVPA